MGNDVMDRLKSKGFMEIQLRQIQLGLTEQLPVEIYAKPEYDWFQMEEIRKGLKARVDVSVYAKPEIPYEKMRQIRKGLQVGLDLTPFLEWDAGIIREFRHACIERIDISAYIEQGYDAGQLNEICKALKKGIALESYINNEYRAASIAEIRTGLENGVDVSSYAKIFYSWRQMREIRLGMENRLDVTKYSSKLYNWEQMREIRLGLEAGLNVEDYRLLRYTAKEMRKRRLSILSDIHSEQNRILLKHDDVGNGVQSEKISDKATRREGREPDVTVINKIKGIREAVLKGTTLSREELLAIHQFSEKMDLKNKTEIKSDSKPILGRENLKLDFEANNMEVYLTIVTQNGIVPKKVLMDFLEENNVRTGISEAVVERISNGKYDKKAILIAQGKIPIKGADGWYEYFFRTDVEKKPKVLEDGSVDYRDIEWFEVVKEGQKLAFYHEAEEGTDGYDVSGNIIKARKGIEKRVLRGKGFRLEEDKKTYTAIINGMICLDEDEMSITNHLVLDEINMTTGNIIFDGSIHIRGDVGSGMTVKATGDVVVDGNVEIAVIESGGSIMLKKGMNSSGNGMVVAAKNVVSRFFEATKVVADGNIEVDKCLNSQLYAKGMITSTRIVAGGVSRSETGFYMNNVGNHAGLKTVLKVQLDDKVRNEYQNVVVGIREVSHELEMLNKTYQEFMEKFSAQDRSTLEIFQKVEKAVFTKSKQLSQLKTIEEELKKLVEKAKSGRVVIGGHAYEGTVVEISGCRWEAANQHNVTIKQHNSQMSVFNN